MTSRLNNRAYLNFILTVIAVLLLALTLNAYRVSIASSAHAQGRLSDIGFSSPEATAGASVAKRAAPIDVSNIATTQDLAVAGATAEVASANREIAQAIRELALAIAGIGPFQPGVAPPLAAAPEMVPGAAPGSLAPLESMVEVGPARR
jgi:hypothetical protein